MAKKHEFSFNATLRIWNDGKHKGSRHFVTVEQKVADKIKAIAAEQPRKGRGSVKVRAMIGFLDRETSIFPDKKSGSYVLPVKASVRKELKIEDGSDVHVKLTLI